jgi:hypothetical protein
MMSELDNRIAAALTDTTIASDEIAELVGDVESELAVATKDAAEVMRQRPRSLRCP